jgi:hypothetical protein
VDMQAKFDGSTLRRFDFDVFYSFHGVFMAFIPCR